MSNITLRTLNKPTEQPTGNPGVDLEALWAPIVAADAALTAAAKENQETRTYKIGRTTLKRAQRDIDEADKRVRETFSQEASQAIQTISQAIDKAQEQRVRACHDKTPRLDEVQRGIRDDLVRIWRAKLEATKMDYQKPQLLQEFANQAAHHVEVGTAEALPRLYALQELVPDAEIPEDWLDTASSELARAQADLLAIDNVRREFEALVARRKLQAGGLSNLESIAAKRVLYQAGHNPNL